MEGVRRNAHLALGAIRLLNGILALLLPRATARRLGVDPDANPAPIYPLRMFGVRTVVLGAELLFGDERTRALSLRTGVLIHASDTVAAALAGAHGHVPRRTGVLLTAISALNTTLAVLGSSAQRRSRVPGRRRRGLL